MTERRRAERRLTESGAPRIAAFVVLAYGWAWLWWAFSIVLLHGSPEAPIAAVSTFLGTCAPLVAAWVMWWRASGARGAWRRLGRCLVPSGPWSTWAIPALAIVVVLAAAAGVQQRLGGQVPASPALWLIAPMLLIQLVVGGGQEEIGWRGWLQPALRERRGRLLAPLAVGAIWFCWHLPLWWMPGSIQTFIPMPAFAMMTVGLSLLQARALEMTGGRAAVAIWLHALNNLAATWFVFVTPVVDAAQPGSWVMGCLYLLVGVTAMLVRGRRVVMDSTAASTHVAAPPHHA